MTSQLETRIGYRFHSSGLLKQALTHKSYSNENKDLQKDNNERLEFLGDAVLDLVLSDFLMQTWPEANEGMLSKKRASLVNEIVLSEIARELELQNDVLLGKGEVSTAGGDKPRILASTLEALIGAVYLDGGYGAAQKWVGQLFQSRIAQLDETEDFANDFKTRLQELCQKQFGGIPRYTILGTQGPEHAKEFMAEVEFSDMIKAQGRGKTKKQAEQAAAQQALEGIACQPDMLV